MSGHPPGSGSLVVADYVVFALMLVVSAAVGFYYACKSRGRESSRDFLTGGGKLTALPVAVSLSASFMSSITVLSNPAEVYCFGAIFAFFAVAYVGAIVVAAEIFLPVYYRLNITSTNEYLELRFNKVTRLLGTALFIIQTVLYTGIVIYGPALALNQVTGLHLWGGILSSGIVCVLYCSLGGLKAVVWTDVFQIGIMLSGYISVIIKSMLIKGGVHTIISDSDQGGRLNFLDFDPNPLRRHTFWTTVFGGMSNWIAAYGTNQAQVQRYVSCKSLNHARGAMYINLVCLCTFLMCSLFTGLCLYSVYKDCDPWSAGLVSATDQLVPYLVMDTLTGYPGLPGLFFAAVCSGSLSTVSSSINALAAVTLEDLIKPYIRMSEKHLTWVSKGLSVLFGIVCIAMAGLASLLGGMMQAGVTVSSVISGPILGLFTMGILCPFANSKGGLSGLLSGLVVTVCLTVGSLTYPPPTAMTRPLALSTEGCGDFNWTSTAPPTEPSFVTTATTHISDNHLMGHNWHFPSYLYTGPLGTLTAIIVGLTVSLLTGGWWSKTEPTLTLMREDTMSYHLFRLFKDQVRWKASKIVLKTDTEMSTGNAYTASFTLT